MNFPSRVEMGSSTRLVFIRFNDLTFNDSPSSMAFQEQRDDAEQNQKQHDDQRDEAVAGDALFVAHRAQAVDAAGGEIIHKARIAWWSGRENGCAGGSTARANRICARRVRCNGRRIRRRRATASGSWIDLLKNRLVRGGLGRGRRLGGARNGFAVRNGGGTEFRRGRALDLRVELFDLGFERGDLVVERAGAVGNRVGLFFSTTPYGNFNAAPEWR